MNRKWLEIFEKWRKKKYEIDLEKLQEDLAGRGLVSSGIRKKEETWLADEYNAEVEMKRAEGKNIEIERREQSKERGNSIRTNRVLAGVAIISLLITAWFNWDTLKTSENINRPYLSLINSSLEFTDPAIESKNFNQLRFETYLTNIGNLPARFKITDVYHVGYDKIFWTPEEPIDGIIFPEQKVRLSWILSWDNDSADFLKWAKEEMNPTFWFAVEKVIMRIDYSFAAENNYSYFTELQSELTRVRNGKIGISEFSWKITNAR